MTASVLVVCPVGAAPGLLSFPAWEALRAAPVVLAGRAPRQLGDAGLAVRVVTLDPDLLVDAVREHGRLVWLAEDQPETAAVAVAAGSRDLSVTVVRSGQELPGNRLLEVVAVMDRLRSPGGCPWDAAQTHRSLARYLLEETYEAYQALEDGDLPGLREELGDVLLQVVFHARLGQDDPQPWSIDDVAADLVEKLVRRHPHVFAGAPVRDLESAWEAGKAAEKGRTSVTDGVPLGQPALMLAAKLQSRAARLGAPLPAYDGIGGALWDLVTRCREQGVDAEEALRAVARRFRDELVRTEAEVRADGHDPLGLRPDQWLELWSRPRGAPGASAAAPAGPR